VDEASDEADNALEVEEEEGSEEEEEEERDGGEDNSF